MRRLPSRRWRFRRCPKCQVVRAAGDFAALDHGQYWRDSGHARRSCPSCGFTGPTPVFKLVREQRSTDATASKSSGPA
jgi:hypothetical protein